MRKALLILGLLASVAIGACRAPEHGIERPSLVGRWVGTYRQLNVGISYPMDISITEHSGGLEVVSDWKWKGMDARTLGHGRTLRDGMAWTEEDLVHGSGVVLGGEYIARRTENGLEGTYLLEEKEEGRFTIARAE